MDAFWDDFEAFGRILGRQVRLKRLRRRDGRWPLRTPSYSSGGDGGVIQHAFGPQGPGALFTLRASRRGRSGLGDERRKFKKDFSNISPCTPGVIETGGLAGKSAKILSHNPTAC